MLNVCIRIDNSTAFSYINAMGGTHYYVMQPVSKNYSCKNDLSACLFMLVIFQVLTTPLLIRPAGFFHDVAEIMLKPEIFKYLCAYLDIWPAVDLFATKQNNQLPVLGFLET